MDNSQKPKWQQFEKGAWYFFLAGGFLGGFVMIQSKKGEDECVWVGDFLSCEPKTEYPYVGWGLLIWIATGGLLYALAKYGKVKNIYGSSD